MKISSKTLGSPPMLSDDLSCYLVPSQSMNPNVATAPEPSLPNPSNVFYRPKTPKDYKGFQVGPHRRIKLIHVNVVHPKDGSVSQDMDIYLSGGFIESIEPSSPSSSESVPEDNKHVVDCTGLYACPGLVDCHTHLNGDGPLSDTSSVSVGEPKESMVFGSTFSMRGYLARGFTTVRDVGGASRSHAAATDSWLIPGPRIFQCGACLSQTGGHGHASTSEPYVPGNAGRVQSGTCWVVDGVEGCLKATRQLLMAGADHVKICTSGGVLSSTDKLTSLQFTTSEIRAIVTAAEDLGATMVTAHCFTSPAIQRSIKAGIRGIEHGAFLDRNTARMMKAANVFFVPTLAICDLYLKVPEFGQKLSSVQMDKMKMVGSAGWNAIKIAEEEGVTVCYGTDLGGGIMATYQTEEFVSRAAILPSPVVLKQATTNGGKILNRPGLIGTLSPGAYADLLLLSSNPLEDVTILNEPEVYFKGILKDGRCVMSLVEGLKVEIAI